MKAFAVEGGPLQVPGPLMRVPEGTEVRAVVRNRLSEALAIHGLYARHGRGQAAAEIVLIPPGDTREIVFLAGRRGTYYYWGATAADTPIGQRSPADMQLSGAFVVDPPGGVAAPDRILLIGGWANGAPLGSAERRFRFVINGRSWPHTERLSYAVGESHHHWRRCRAIRHAWTVVDDRARAVSDHHRRSSTRNVPGLEPRCPWNREDYRAALTHP